MFEKLIALERPVVFFDTETTGTNPRADRVVEIACVKIFPDGRRETLVRRLDPGMPIPPAATAIHGIDDADISGCPSFAEFSEELVRFFEDCDLAGYNVAGFDLPVLRAEFWRAGLEFDVSSRRILDAQRIFFAHEPRHLSAAARFYCGRDHAGAHGALADAEMSVDVLAGQLARYGDLPRSVSELHELYCAGLDRDMDPDGRIRLVNGEPTVNFGRNRGRTLKEIGREDPSFLEWILREEFSRPVKEIVRTYLPTQPALFS